MAPVDVAPRLGKTWEELALGLVLALLTALPTGYLLARLSLEPVRRSVEMMDDFVNGIIHDIGTPLSVIKMNAQAMEPELGEEAARKNARVLRGAEHLEALEQQLTFSLKVHRFPLEKTLFDLGALLEERKEYWNGLRLSVPVEVESSPLTVEADRNVLLRMLDNLVSNAVRYSPRNTPVTVRMEEKALVVEDRGKGMENPSDLLFSKYYREETGTKGLGLGLYIVKEAAKLHGLKVWIDSAPGKGTRAGLELGPITRSLHSSPVG